MQRLVKLPQQLFLWVLTILLCLTMGGLPAAAQNDSSARMLAVTGHGEGYAPVTLTQVSLGLANKGDSVKATYADINQRSAAVVRLLKTNKAEGVKTSNISLNPQYGRDSKPAKATYEGSQTIDFQLPVSKIAVLDKILAADVDSLHSIRYGASEAAIVTARDQALENAIADAQAQAKVALKSLGFSLQDVTDIRIDHTQVKNVDSQPVAAEKSYSSRWSAATSTDKGEQAVAVQVTLQMRY